MWQPTDLRGALTHRQVAYQPGQVDPETGAHLPSLTVFEPEEGYYLRRGLRLDRQRPLLLVTYGDASDHVLLLFQQPARPDDSLPAGAEARVGVDRATLADVAGGTLLSTIAEGTWLQVWSNLEPASVHRALGSLRVTSRASAETLARVVELPEIPPSSNVTGHSPAFYRPTYLPTGLGGGGSGFGPPAGRRAGPPPAGSPSRLGAGPISREDMDRIPFLERINWEWFGRMWSQWGGGAVAIAFTADQSGSGPNFLFYEQLGPAKLARDPVGAQSVTPRGRTVWRIGAVPAGLGFDAHWWDGSVVQQQSRRADGGPPGELWVWAHSETLIRIESDRAPEEVLRFVDELVVVSK